MTRRNPGFERLPSACARRRFARGAAHFLSPIKFSDSPTCSTLSQTSYPRSRSAIRRAPSTRGRLGALKDRRPGVEIMGDRPFGEGDQPRFALMAADDAAARDLIKSHPTLVEGNLRSPPDKAAVWLVRPDGYAGAAAHASDWKPIRDCLAQLTFASVGRILGCGREDVPGASPRFSASANSLPGLEIGLSAIGRVAIAILTHVAKPLVLGANIGGPT